jgi:hypothetical protein
VNSDDSDGWSVGCVEESTILTEMVVRLQAIYKKVLYIANTQVLVPGTSALIGNLNSLDIVHKRFSLLLSPRRNALTWRNLTIVEITVLTNTAPFGQN